MDAKVARTARSLVAALLAVVLVGPGHASGNGLPGPRRAGEHPTAYEHFVLSGCSPCVKEVHPVAALSVPPLRTSAFGRASGGPMTQPGEIGVEILRAYPLGRASRQRLALRVTLMVGTGVAGEVYRIGSGLLDEDDVGALVDSVDEMKRAASSGATGADENVEIAFHGGSLRVGVVRLRGDTIAFVQGGDVERLALNPVWEVPTTMFLPDVRLPALADLLRQGAAKIQELRAAR